MKSNQSTTISILLSEAICSVRFFISKTSKFKNFKPYFNQVLSLVLLFAFIFCTTASFSLTPISHSFTKAIQKQSESSGENDIFVLDKLEEDGDDDSVDAPIVFLSNIFSISFTIPLYFKSGEIYYFLEQPPNHTPLFISNRILRL